MNGDAFGAGFDTGDLEDSIDQRLAVMRAGAADERAVDVEENQVRNGDILRGSYG